MTAGSRRRCRIRARLVRSLQRVASSGATSRLGCSVTCRPQRSSPRVRTGDQSPAPSGKRSAAATGCSVRGHHRQKSAPRSSGRPGGSAWSALLPHHRWRTVSDYPVNQENASQVLGIPLASTCVGRRSALSQRFTCRVRDCSGTRNSFSAGRSVLSAWRSALLTTIRSGTACQVYLTRVFRPFRRLGSPVVPEREFPFSGPD